MRIISLSQKGKSSGFVFRDILYRAGINEHEVVETRPLGLHQAHNAAEKTDLIIVEALQDFDVTKNTVAQSLADFPDTPVFVLYHSEAQPQEQAERNSIKHALIAMGAQGFADVNDGEGFCATSIIRTLGFEPEFTTDLATRSNIHIGDIRFNVIEKKAYSLKEAQHYDEDIGGQFQPIAVGVTQTLFTARGAKVRMGETFQNTSNQPPIFDLTPEEAKFIETLGRRQGDFVSLPDIINKMYMGVFTPEHSFVHALHHSVTQKIATRYPDAETYVIFDPNTASYALNDHEFSIKPVPVNQPPERDIEKDVYGDIDPEAELFGHLDAEDDGFYPER